MLVWLYTYCLMKLRDNALIMALTLIWICPCLMLKYVLLTSRRHLIADSNFHLCAL
jgi:hypothetical protein